MHTIEWIEKCSGEGNVNIKQNILCKDESSTVKLFKSGILNTCKKFKKQKQKQKQKQNKQTKIKHCYNYFKTKHKEAVQQ